MEQQLLVEIRGFWVFLAALLLLFAVPSILSAFWR